MLNQVSLIVLQSLVISREGLVMAVAALAVLAIAIKLYNGVISLERAKKAGRQPHDVVMEDGIAEADYAVILAVMNAELNSGGEMYRVISITKT